MQAKTRRISGEASKPRDMSDLRTKAFAGQRREVGVTLMMKMVDGWGRSTCTLLRPGCGGTIARHSNTTLQSQRVTHCAFIKNGGTTPYAEAVEVAVVRWFAVARAAVVH